ncbi:MAG: hypothetical protein AAGE52_29585 [Myxococcota bacterium]
MIRFVASLVVVAGFWGVAKNARACAYDDNQGVVTGLELSAGLGVMGHNTTGVGEPLLGHGYDREAGPAVDGKLRLLFGDSRFYRHGLTFRVGYTAGRQFGRNGYGFRRRYGDVGYSFRTLLPCMSNETTKVYAGATVGFTGANADAGIGRGRIEDINENDRREASEALDHREWGWVLGGEIQVHIHSFMVGLDVDMRRLYGRDTVADRIMLGSAVLRVGMAFDWSAAD